MHLSANGMQDLCRLAPVVVLCVFGIVLMMLEPLTSSPAAKRALGWIGFLGSIAALCSVRVAAWHPGYAYGGLLRVDDFSVFLNIVILGSASLAILGSIQYLDNELLQRGEFYSLILFAAAGMCVLSGSTELITAFIGLEMSSISSYVLAGFRRNAEKSTESSFKYFVLGSFATAFFLYGVAMIYGATGTTQFDGIQSALAAGGLNSLVVLAFGMMFVGLAFKAVIAPFQTYAPDVYEGAPTPVTTLLASGPKAATFAVMLRIFYVAFGPVQHIWFWPVWICAILTMSIGNFAALAQSNVKRMLAYSSIAHAGYILVAFAASTQIGVAAVLFYLAAYAIMTIGAFTVVTHFGGRGEKKLTLSDYAGLGKKQPVVAACLTVFLLSLLGLPAMGGFLGKFYAFQAGLDAHLIGLVIIAAINSVVGACYYLRVILAMYFQDSTEDWTPQRVAVPLGFVLALCVIGTFYLGLFPSRTMAFALRSAASLLR